MTGSGVAQACSSTVCRDAGASLARLSAHCLVISGRYSFSVRRVRGKQRTGTNAMFTSHSSSSRSAGDRSDVSLKNRTRRLASRSG